MRQMTSTQTPPKSFILDYTILHLNSVIITTRVILEICIMRKALSCQNVFGACKKEFTIRWKILSHAKGMKKRGYCSLCLGEKLWLLRYFDDMLLTRNLNSLANAYMRPNY